MTRHVLKIFITCTIFFTSTGCLNAEEKNKSWNNNAPSGKNLYTGDMGFTPWPYDLTEKALDDTYSFINKNATIIAHHLDGGVPWPEALKNRALPASVISDWKKRQSKTGDHLKVFLSITPLNFGRNGLASYWSKNGDNQPLPEDWKRKSLNDPQVKKAFLNYALRAVESFKPSYLAIGIESNIMITKEPNKWPEYIDLNAYIYQGIKAKYPDLPVFSTVQYEHLRGIEGDSKPNVHLQKPAVEKLMKHSDYLALSTYRYGLVHPNPPTEDYFKEALSFGKPVAIAEAGAMSETTIVMGMPLISNQKNQKEFISMILYNAQRHNFPFVINWVAIDFDAMISKIPSEMRGIAKAWVHTGMIDEDMDEKRAFKVWKKHLNK